MLPTVVDFRINILVHGRLYSPRGAVWEYVRLDKSLLVNSIWRGEEWSGPRYWILRIQGDPIRDNFLHRLLLRLGYVYVQLPSVRASFYIHWGYSQRPWLICRCRLVDNFLPSVRLPWIPASSIVSEWVLQICYMFRCGHRLLHTHNRKNLSFKSGHKIDQMHITYPVINYSHYNFLFPLETGNLVIVL